MATIGEDLIEAERSEWAPRATMAKASGRTLLVRAGRQIAGVEKPTTVELIHAVAREKYVEEITHKIDGIDLYGLGREMNQHCTTILHLDLDIRFGLFVKWNPVKLGIAVDRGDLGTNGVIQFNGFSGAELPPDRRGRTVNGERTVGLWLFSQYIENTPAFEVFRRRMREQGLFTSLQVLPVKRGVSTLARGFDAHSHMRLLMTVSARAFTPVTTTVFYNQQPNPLEATVAPVISIDDVLVNRPVARSGLFPVFGTHKVSRAPA